MEYADSLVSIGQYTHTFNEYKHLILIPTVMLLESAIASQKIPLLVLLIP